MTALSRFCMPLNVVVSIWLKVYYRFFKVVFMQQMYKTVHFIEGIKLFLCNAIRENILVFPDSNLWDQLSLPNITQDILVDDLLYEFHMMKPVRTKRKILFFLWTTSWKRYESPWKKKWHSMAIEAE